MKKQIKAHYTILDREIFPVLPADLPQGQTTISSGTRRTCVECQREKSVKYFGVGKMICFKCENNKKDIPPETQFAIEIGGTRIRVCKSCLREFLGI